MDSNVNVGSNRSNFWSNADKYGGACCNNIAFIFYTFGIYFLYTGPNTGIFFQIHMGLLIGIGLGGTAISIPMSVVGKHFPLSNKNNCNEELLLLQDLLVILFHQYFTNYSLKETWLELYSIYIFLYF